MKSQRTGYTTGTCAAAAAKAAAILLAGRSAPAEVEVRLADGSRARLAVVRCRKNGRRCAAAVRKDAGGDPDVTHGSLIVASVAWAPRRRIIFRAGDGVGTVTKPGLAVPPGEPAINPVPRQMIERAVREITDRGMEITVSIPGGRKLAARTFNPRLGVKGGLSILGTTGRVRPFSTPALREALRCAVNVAEAVGITAPVLVPGHIGERAAHRQFHLQPEQVIEAGNEWGFILDEIAKRRFRALLILGHPGKLAKLAAGDWDTHSSRSAPAVRYVQTLGEKILQRRLPAAATVEELLEGLPQSQQSRLGNALAARVQAAIAKRLHKKWATAVVLINLKGETRGSEGDLSPWQ